MRKCIPTSSTLNDTFLEFW